MLLSPFHIVVVRANRIHIPRITLGDSGYMDAEKSIFEKKAIKQTGAISRTRPLWYKK